MNTIILGVDIGGSHITSALIDLDTKSEIKRTCFRNQVNSNATADEIINKWAKTIEKSIASSELKPLGISIAMPGPMDYVNGICQIKDQDKYRSLFGLNIKESLATRLGMCSSKIFFQNDAACFLKGEVFGGILHGVDKAIGLTVGTGLGTSHFREGRAYDSDLWNMPFLNGIAEDYISTRWFVRRFKELSGITVKDVKDLVDNYNDSLYFKSLFLEFSINLAKFMHKFIRKNMAVAAVIGGNIAQAESYFLDDTRRFLAEMLGYNFPIERSVLGEKAALIGASSSFKNNF